MIQSNKSGTFNSVTGLTSSPRSRHGDKATIVSILPATRDIRSASWNAKFSHTTLYRSIIPCGPRLKPGVRCLPSGANGFHLDCVRRAGTSSTIP